MIEERCLSIRVRLTVIGSRVLGLRGMCGLAPFCPLTTNLKSLETRVDQVEDSRWSDSDFDGNDGVRFPSLSLFFFFQFCNPLISYPFFTFLSHFLFLNLYIDKQNKKRGQLYFLKQSCYLFFFIFFLYIFKNIFLFFYVIFGFDSPSSHRIPLTCSDTSLLYPVGHQVFISLSKPTRK